MANSVYVIVAKAIRHNNGVVANGGAVFLHHKQGAVISRGRSEHSFVLIEPVNELFSRIPIFSVCFIAPGEHNVLLSSRLIKITNQNLLVFMFY